MTIRSFAARQAAADQRAALETVTVTDRLLVQILIELMETRGHQGAAAIAARLTMIGLTTKQIAALLGTTPASVAVARGRSKQETPDPQ